jgi:hypothetical protein
MISLIWTDSNHPHPALPLEGGGLGWGLNNYNHNSNRKCLMQINLWYDRMKL